MRSRLGVAPYVAARRWVRERCLLGAYGMELLSLSAWGNISQPVMAIGLFGAMIIACLIGFGSRALVVRHVRRIAEEEEKPSGQETSVVAEVLGLLALLLAFTFGVALDRYEARRELVNSEAAAIASTYSIVQMLDEPHRTRLSKLLVAYTDNRIELGERGGTEASLVQTNERLLTDILAASKAASDSALKHGITEPFVEKTTQILEHDGLRKLARLTRVPTGVLVVLFVYVVVAAAMLGYVLDELRARIAACLLFLLLTMSLVVIVDLNRPESGFIREQQTAMRMLRKSMDRRPPAAFDRFETAAPAALPAGAGR